MFWMLNPPPFTATPLILNAHLHPEVHGLRQTNGLCTSRDVDLIRLMMLHISDRGRDNPSFFFILVWHK